MNPELITEDQYEALPAEPMKRFLALEDICRTKMLQAITHETSSDYDEIIRLQYMMTVASAAETLGINGISYPKEHTSPSSQLNSFFAQVTKLTTRLRLLSSGHGDAYSVQLANRTRGKITIQVNKLRDIIEKSDLPDERKNALFRKLDEFITELEQPRFSFSKAMAILAYIGLGVATTTSFLADAPDAIATITKLIGEDKAAETAEVTRLGDQPKLKALPRPETDGEKQFNADDDIPF